MAQPRKIGIIVGSLRKGSINRKVANSLISLAPQNLEVAIVEIAGLSLYNQDLDDNSPAEWTHFRDTVRRLDGVIFATPEYNRSIPGPLKNALDIGSRPYGKSVWNGKPAAVISASPGAIGGFGANHHLRQSLVSLNMPAMAQPEAYLSAADKLFDASGNLTNENTRKFLQGFMTNFAAWVEQARAG